MTCDEWRIIIQPVQQYFSPLKATYILCMGLCIVCSGCSGGTVNIPHSATGSVAIDPPEVLQKLSDASLLIKNSFHMLVEDAKERTENITEGTEKIMEGKEQIEKGVRGE